MIGWEQYLNVIKNNCRNPNLPALGIIGETGVVWADQNSNMTIPEAKFLSKALTDVTRNDDFFYVRALFGSGFTVGGEKFSVIKVGDRKEGTLYGMGKKGSKFEDGFIAISRIKGAILFAIGKKGDAREDISYGVEETAKYLRQNGFGI